MQYPTPSNHEFSEWLREERERQGWTVRELARRSMVTKSSIYCYQNLSTEPSLTSLAKLIKALGYDYTVWVEWLVKFSRGVEMPKKEFHEPMFDLITKIEGPE